MANRLSKEKSPYLMQHGGESGRLVPMVRGGISKSAARGYASLFEYWLFHLPLVPCDGP